MKEVESSRVFLIPNNLINAAEKINIIKLKHPKTGSLMLCAITPNGSLYEITCVSSKFCSWILEDFAFEDGGLYILTALDPLYMILPYLCKIDKFCPLEDILVDEDNPDARYLTESVSSDDLVQISEFRVVSDLKVYRYDESKVIEWLQKKVSQTAKKLKENEINLNDGSKADILQNENGYSNEEYNCHACKLISEYLNEALSRKLYEAFGLSVEELTLSNGSNGEISQPVKKARTDVNPAEDYSKFFSPDPTNKSVSKLSSSQKQLMKVDKKGMKSISSFFKKK